MKLHSINKEQGLYVMAAGTGFSCYGFAVLDLKARNVLQWLRENGRAAEMLLGAKGVDVLALGVPPRIGTKKHFAACSKILDAGSMFFALSGTRCYSGLESQLKGLEGRRVEVVDRHGETRRFIVGRSSGWMPCHLEIANKRSSGGIGTHGTPFKSVSVIS